jgi:membrane-associated phospholipid phosphatase
MTFESILKRAREHWLMLLVSMGCLLFAYAFLQVGSEVLDGDHKQLDHAVRDWFRAQHTPGGERVFNILTYLGDRYVLLPLAAIVGWPLFRKHREWFVVLLFCGLASAEVNSILKNEFEMLRPPLGLSMKDSFAFPSGHTTAAAAVAAVIGYLALRARIFPLAYVVGAVTVVVVVGFSRIYLDMHWFSDVVGGFLIGSTFSTGVCALFEWLELALSRIRRRRESSLREA